MKHIFMPLIGLLLSLSTLMFASPKATAKNVAQDSIEAKENNPLWLRNPSISPDGKTLLFTFEGDIFSVPTTGGKALQLTTNDAIDNAPTWSHDGTTIAFASDREGNFDIYTMPKEGGVATRLTFNTTAETPMCFTADDKDIVMEANLEPAQDYALCPEARLTQTYLISAKKAGRPRLLTSVCMQRVSANKDGRHLLYQDKKGYENYYRKHHTSHITRNIWQYDMQTGKHLQITTFKGEDRDPVYSPSNKSLIYYVSEQPSSLNVYRCNLNGEGPKPMTSLTRHPVRSLSIANTGLMAFSYNGELYTLQEGSNTPKKVEVKIVSDVVIDEEETDFIGRAQQMAIAPKGNEIAFIVQGDVYVTSVDYKTTVRITNTPQAERSVSFSPDGKSLVYASERDSLWKVYVTQITDKDAESFCYAKSFEEECVTPDNTETCFQPAFSPDGKEVAFLKDRVIVTVVNLKSNKQRVVVPKQYNYSYQDGDQWYQWSPDGQYILVNFFEQGGWNNTDVGLFKADGSGEFTNLTQTGYTASADGFILDGKAVLYSSDKEGFRSHGSWGSLSDYYIMFLDKKTYDEFLMTPEQIEMAKETATKKDLKKETKEETKKEEKIAEGKPLDPLDYDLKNCRNYVVRLTNFSGAMTGGFLTKKADKFYYFIRNGEGYNLWVYDIKKKSYKQVAALEASSVDLQASADLSKVFVLSRGRISKLDLASGRMTPVQMSAEFTTRTAAGRTYIFNHMWQQVKDKFYDPSIRNMDWEQYKKDYARFLPYISNNYDFAEMCSELLGELNGSHTGMRYFNFASFAGSTARLGLFYDQSYKGDGLKVSEVVEGNTIFNAESQVKKGAIITEIDRHPVKQGEDYYRYLYQKAGRRIQLTIENKGKTYEEFVTPMGNSTWSELLYKRWVKRCEFITDSVSQGRVAYVHVKGMDSESFRTVYSNLFGKYRNCKAVVVDTRFNGGGWLHDDLATLLMGVHYVDFAPRGQYIGSEPFNKWTKASALLVSEGNYSDAHGFAYTYQTLKIGKIFGMPVAGTMTAVWWERQIDPSLVFGIPQVGMRDLKGQYIENQELEPDVMVNNDPNTLQSGVDKQLIETVKYLDSQKEEIQEPK